MRSLHKLWKDKRSNYTRRIRWYEGQDGMFRQFRLNVEDHNEHRSANLFYGTREAAQAAWDAFISGDKTVLQLLNENQE